MSAEHIENAINAHSARLTVLEAKVDALMTRKMAAPVASEGSKMTREELRHERRCILDNIADETYVEIRGLDYSLDALEALDAQPAPVADVLMTRIRELEAENAQLRVAHETSLFQQVMQASIDYVTRFGGEIGIEGALEKMREEFDEYIEAIADAYAYEHSRLPPFHLYEKSSEEVRQLAARELIDLLVTVGGLASVIGLKWGHIEQAAHDTLRKLDSRTTETHAWNGKTVERIGREVKP